MESDVRFDENSQNGTNNNILSVFAIRFGSHRLIRVSFFVTKNAEDKD